jgi:hypothetical protein
MICKLLLIVPVKANGNPQFPSYDRRIVVFG